MHIILLLSFGMYTQVSCITSVHELISLIPRLFFHTGREKIVWSTAYSVFVPCGLEIGDATSLKMITWRHIRLETMKELKRDSLLQRSSFSELPNTKKRRITKLEASVNVRKPGQSYRHLKLRNFTLPVVKPRNAHRCSPKSWHSFASPFSGSAWLSLLIALQPPSLLKISYCST